MKKVKARIPTGKTVLTQVVELYTKAEARRLLVDKNWEIDVDIFDAEQPNRRIGWLASFDGGDGIYVGLE